MPPQHAKFTRLDFAWLLAVLLGSSAWCLTAGRELGATFDEPFYIAKGLESWRTSSNRALMRAGTMPLPIDLQTGPLYLWEQSRGAAFNPVSDLPMLLPVARGVSLIFWWLLLVYAGQLGRYWGGSWAGRFAVGWIGTEPNFLAHATLATTDIALTAGVLVAVYHYVIGLGGNWWKRVFVPGGLAGLAICCKASAITFVPLAFLIIAGPWSHRRIVDWAQMACIGTVVLFGYCGCDWATEPSLIRWADSLTEPRFAGPMQFLAQHLCIFPNAGEGIVQQIKHNIRGHGSFVLNQWHPRAVWYYFPIVFSAKLTESVLLLFGGLLVTRPRTLKHTCGAIAIAYLLFSLTCRVQIGIRLMLPLVAFLHLTLAVSLGGCFRRCSGSARWNWVPGVLGILVLALQCPATWWHKPDGLRYSNLFWGGPTTAAERLTDSNYDWGQGLPELAKWHLQQGEPHLTVWYYGTDPAILLPPFHVLQVNQLEQPSIDLVQQRASGGYFAVGTSLLNGCPDRRPETVAVIDWLKSLQPIAKTGTFTIYRFD
jgi:hypothetical protein